MSTFFVNKLLPLIRKSLKKQESTIHIERNLYCKKNVIDEIIRIPLIENSDSLEEVKRNLKRINHFKELGRASYKNPIEMFERISTNDENKLMEYKKIVEAGSNKQKREIAKLKVEFYQINFGKQPVHICPCCGTGSLIRIENKVAECLTCTYKVHSFLDEPQEFGIMDTFLFEINESGII